jgi:nucleoside 2-deoxyribosyltransferase
VKQVYLAGPITGLDYAGATDWREYAIKYLHDVGIQGLSPMRGKAYLQNLKVISGHGKEYLHMGVLSRPESVLTRDYYDATRSDVVLVNLLGAKIISVGTVMEIAFAHAARVPIVCAIEAEGNLHNHMMINQAIGFRVETLDDALDIVASILV